MFKYILSILREKKLLLVQVLSLILLITTSLLNLYFPLLGGKVIDEYFQSSSVSRGYMIGIIGVLIFSTILAFLNSYVTAYLSEKIGYQLKNFLIDKILKQSLTFFNKFQQSHVFTVISSDVVFIKNTLGNTINALISSIFLLIGSIILMFSIDTTVAIYVVLIIPTILIFIFFLFRNVGKIFQQSQEIRDKLNKIIDENIKGAMFIKTSVAEKFEVKKFQLSNKDYQKIGERIVNIFAMVIPIINSTNLIGSLIVLFLGGDEVIKGHMTLGDLSAFNNYVIIFSLPILMIGFISASIGQAFASLRRINEVLDAENTFTNGEIEIEKLQSIQFNNVNYHIEKTDILKKISFKFNRGEKIGLIGLTGSGKTTIINLLLKQILPTKGDILINDVNLNNINILKLREKIGLVSQDIWISDSSIYENIDFDRKLGKEAILKAAKIAQVDEFAKRYKDQYKEKVGERGTKLSGGQKQRIAIARALAGKPELLILDDSTSMLDISTERNILEAVKNEYPDITIIIVAQKIASIKDCDQIFVMDYGVISESGTHDVLKEKSYLYKEIELSQSNYAHEL